MRSFIAHPGAADLLPRARGRMLRLCVALAAVVLLAGCEPLWVLPGGALGGTESRVPDDWAFSDAVATVQLETGTDAYSVNVWGVAVGPHFYVASSRGGGSRWAQHIVQTPAVRLRIDDAVYPLRASRVDEEAELATVIAAYVRKYEVEQEENFVTTAWVFRLDARDS
ncbi:MAG: DUF2255 family protein [Gammaproteobacteria bacterium]|nr:DUF2255 family protein [Gammaproteobacteria bacterium]